MEYFWFRVKDSWLRGIRCKREEVREEVRGKKEESILVDDESQP